MCCCTLCCCWKGWASGGGPLSVAVPLPLLSSTGGAGEGGRSRSRANSLSPRKSVGGSRPSARRGGGARRWELGPHSRVPARCDVSSGAPEGAQRAPTVPLTFMLPQSAGCRAVRPRAEKSVEPFTGRSAHGPVPAALLHPTEHSRQIGQGGTAQGPAQPPCLPGGPALAVDPALSLMPSYLPSPAGLSTVSGLQHQ